MPFFGNLMQGPSGSTYGPGQSRQHAGGFWNQMGNSQQPAPMAAPPQTIGGFNANQVPPGFLEAMRNTNPGFGQPQNPPPAPVQPPVQQQPGGGANFPPQMLARGLMR